MSDYNINLNNLQSPSNTPRQDNSQYTKAFFASLGVALVVAIVEAVIAMIFGAEYMLVLIIGAIVVGFPIRSLVQSNTVKGAIIGAICCPLTYFLYQIILAMFGYYYENSGELEFWLLLIGSAIYGAYIGYNND